MNDSKTEYLFKCKTNKAYVLKILMELLHHTVKLACFQISPSGIYLRMMDSNQKLLIDCNLKAENFTLFYFNSEVENQTINIGVNLNHFYKMLKSIKKRDLNSKLVRRRGRVYVINKINPKFKARQK